MDDMVLQILLKDTNRKMSLEQNLFTLETKVLALILKHLCNIYVQ